MAFQVLFTNCPEELQVEILALIEHWNNTNEGYTVHTSGSTGKPKALHLTRQQLIASAKRSNQYFKLNENSRVLLAMNPNTIGGKMVLIRALVGHYNVEVVPASANPLIQISDKTSYDFTSLVPFQIQRILEETPNKLNQFTQILLGGMPLSESKEAVLLGLKSTYYIGFGMTETVSHIAMRKLGDQIYTCLDGVQVSTDTNSCLIIQDQQLNIKQLHTTDQVKLLNNSQFQWLGRMDFAINSGGIKIHPEALERELESIIDKSFIIAGLASEHWNQECVLVVEELLSGAIWNQVQQTVYRIFGKYAVPKRMVVAPIIRKANGKIDRINTIKQLTHD